MGIKDMLIIEIKTQVDTSFNWFIDIVKIQEYMKCAYCGENIIKDKVSCDSCSQVNIMFFNY
jgi:hypothetical protein